MHISVPSFNLQCLTFFVFAHFSAVIYAGDVDFICNYLGNRAWTQALDWNHKEEFNQSEDVDWFNGSGMVRSSNGFTFLQVYDAGHMVPTDQPEAAFQLINTFIAGENFV